MKSDRRLASRRGFTLIELLVVIGIIIVLMAILLPVVSRVRKDAYNATTQQQMSRILTAAEAYYHDFNAYPGPVANVFLSGGSKAGADPTPIKNTTPTAITSSENLVLGLLGYIDVTSGGSPNGGPATFTYNNGGAAAGSPAGPPPHDVFSLNPLHPASFHYLDYVADELSPGQSSKMEFAAAASPAPTDSNVPEFIDRFPDHLPILYVRAFPGGSGNPPVGTADLQGGQTVQYNVNELKDYGSYAHKSDGSGQWIPFAPSGPSSAYTMYSSNSLADDEAVPFNDWWSNTPASGQNFYFMNPNIAGAVRGKDGFVLISAGLDRTYGTLDDIIVTP